MGVVVGMGEVVGMGVVEGMGVVLGVLHSSIGGSLGPLIPKHVLLDDLRRSQVLLTFPQTQYSAPRTWNPLQYPSHSTGLENSPGGALKPESSPRYSHSSSIKASQPPTVTDPVQSSRVLSARPPITPQLVL